MLNFKSKNRKILAPAVCFLMAVLIWIPLNQFVKADSELTTARALSTGVFVALRGGKKGGKR